MCRYWGLESELIKNHQDDRFSSDKVGLRTRRAQVPYGNIGPPEFQIAAALSNWKLEVIMVLLLLLLLLFLLLLPYYYNFHKGREK